MLLLIYTAGGMAAHAQNPFVTLWNPGSSTTLIIPALGDYTYELRKVSDNSLVHSGTHSGTLTMSTLLDPDTDYRLSITPTGANPFYAVDFQTGLSFGSGHQAKLKDIEQWGDIVWGNGLNFRLATGLTTVTAADIPDLSSVTNLSNFFWDASNLQSVNNLENWDVSNVTDFGVMFRNAGSFNQDISGWDMSSATIVGLMFMDASSFNQDISGWDMSSVTTIGSMFRGATSFNQNLGSWDLSKVLNTILRFNDMLRSSGLSCENYSLTLIGWASNPNMPNGLNLGNVSGLTYGPAGKAARDYLTAPVPAGKGWTIGNQDTFDPACAILPVRLISFEVSKRDNYTVLNWETASETNNSHFEVEHAQDAVNFTVLGKVKGNDTTEEDQRYSFIHHTPAPGINYYRLKQVDYDGVFEYSVIRSIIWSSPAGEHFKAYPNPVEGYIVLSGLTGASVVEIVDIQGRAVYRKTNVKETGLSVNTSRYHQGTYIVRIVKDGQVETKKININ